MLNCTLRGRERHIGVTQEIKRLKPLFVEWFLFLLFLVTGTHCNNFGVQAAIAMVVFLECCANDGNIDWGISEIKI